METIIDFIRHGEPEGGSRYRGNSIDDPLSEKGWSQMRTAVGNACPWQRVVSSPLLRCHAFAREFCQQNSLPLTTDDRLKEVGFGAWEGFTREQVQARDLAQYKAFYADPVNHRPPGAEPLADFFTRVSQAMGAIAADFSGQQILVVAHAGVIRAALARVLEVPEGAAYRVQVVNAGLTRICHGPDGFKLAFVNRESV
jgi:alpha-ribazole phosphatase/probable phosphoglycerate mutase